MKHIFRESWRVPFAAVRLLQFEMPLASGQWLAARIKELLGAAPGPRFQDHVLDAVWRVVQALGPLYGKALQVSVSQLSTQLRERFGLERVYSGWDAMSTADFEALLDEKVPQWRQKFTGVSTKPLGVASMAEVRLLEPAIDGKLYVAKVLKPESLLKMRQSLAALGEIAALLRPFCLTRKSRNAHRHLVALAASFRQEMDLRTEVGTMERVRALSAKRYAKNQNVFFIPEVLADMSGAEVLIMEAVSGEPLGSVDPQTLSASLRKHLSQRFVQEMLVQIFEQGVFHADPHGGNLILTPDHRIGIIDWGLAGELTEADRKFIAAMLRAILAKDLSKLAKVLTDLATARGEPLSRKQQSKLDSELAELAQWLLENKKHQRPVRLSTFAQRALTVAESCGMTLPDSLLLMIKTLITVEGLAKGLHADISLARVGAPVLLRVFRPRIGDVVFSVGRWLGLGSK